MFIDRSNAFSVDGYGLLNLALRYVRGAGEPFNVLGTVRVRLR